MVYFVHLSCSYWFTSNIFYLHVVFIASWRISPLTAIWRSFILFWRNSAIQISQLDISSGLSVSRLLIPQCITAYLSDCGRGIFLDLHKIFWVLSPLILQFTASLLKVSSQTLLYLIKPGTMESPLTIVHVLLFVSRSATCLLCFSNQSCL